MGRRVFRRGLPPPGPVSGRHSGFNAAGARRAPNPDRCQTTQVGHKATGHGLEGGHSPNGQGTVTGTGFRRGGGETTFGRQGGPRLQSVASLLHLNAPSVASSAALAAFSLAPI